MKWAARVLIIWVAAELIGALFLVSSLGHELTNLRCHP